MKFESPTLTGRYIRLEPICYGHVDGLTDAAAADSTLYQWSTVPQGKTGFTSYVENAISLRDAGSAVPFAIVRFADNAVIGSTRFWNIDIWPWPKESPRHGKCFMDGCEIGYTWFARSAIRTVANSEAKLLMLTHAFEVWNVLRICFHADARNKRSGAALERIGATYEGLLRAHRFAIDHTARDSLRYSIIAAQWPEIKGRLKMFVGKE